IYDLSLGAHDALRDGGLAGDEGARNLDRREAGHRPKGQGNLRIPGQRWMAAGEDQPQSIVALRRVISHEIYLQLRELVPEASLTPQLIDGLAPGGRQQPGTWFLRNALSGPVLDGFEQCLLHQLFGEVEVAQDPDQRRGQPTCLLSEDRGQRGVGRGTLSV